jgi:hypothetical protein
MMCQDGILLGQKRNQVRISAESPMNLPLAVAVLPECELEKIHTVKAILVAKSSDPLCQGGKHSLLVGWLMVSPGV